MQTLQAGDPERLGPWVLIGRVDRDTGVVAYEGSSDGLRAVLQCFELEGDPVLAAEQVGATLPRIPELGDGVAAIVDAGIEGRTGWIATVQVDGPTLGASVLSSGPLAADAWDRLAVSLLAGLERIHAAGFVHGHITPDSVVLSHGSAVLVDFGLTQVVKAAAASGAFPARVAWMTPEQIAGEQPVAASDVFAAGSLLAFAATGRGPWGSQAAPTSQLVTRISLGECDVNGATSAQKALVGVLLNPDPLSRPTAADALSLCRVAPGAAVVEPDATLLLPAPDPATKPEAVPVAAIPTLPLATPRPAPSTPRESATVEPRVPRPSATRHRTLITALLALGVVAAVGVAVGVSTRQPPTPPQIASSPSTTATPTPTPTATSSDVPPSASADPVVPPSYTTRVNYSNRSIPDKVFDGTLGWSFDVCLSDLGTARPVIKGAIAMYRAENGKWRRQSEQVTAVRGGRCGEDRVNVTIDSMAVPPSRSATDGSWNPCSKYRVVIPETSRFAKTYIDFCVQTRIDRA